MIVRGPRAERDFTIIRNATLRDARLTFKARGLLAFILSQPEGYRVSAEELAGEGPDGRDAIRSALREMETAGYLRREKRRTGDGRLMTDAVLFEVPEVAAALPDIEEPETRKRRSADPLPSWVYYVALPDGLVKIGWSANPWKRAGQLGGELRAVEPGDYAREQEVHAEFADDRIEGETFSASPRVSARIDALRRAARQPRTGEWMPLPGWNDGGKPATTGNGFPVVGATRATAGQTDDGLTGAGEPGANRRTSDLEELEKDYSPSAGKPQLLAVPSASSPAPRRSDPLWDALVAEMGYTPQTKAARGAWNGALGQLRDTSDCDAEEIAARCAEFRRRWPTVSLTPTALAKHWDALGVRDTAAAAANVPRGWAGIAEARAMRGAR